MRRPLKSSAQWVAASRVNRANRVFDLPRKRIAAPPSASLFNTVDGSSTRKRGKSLNTTLTRPRYMPPGGGGGGGHAGRGGPVRPVYPGGGGGHNKGPDGGGGAAGERGGVIDQQDLKLISKLNLNKLARDVDPNAILEDEVIDFLLKLSEDFIDTVVTGSCALGELFIDLESPVSISLLAKHRKSPTLDTADIKLCLSRQFDLQIPGFPIEDLQLKKQQTGEAHKQRLQLIRKQMKR